MKYLGVLLLGVAVFVASYVYSKRFLEWLKFQSLGTRDYLVEKLNMMFIEASPEKVLLYLVIASGGLGGLVFLLLLPNVLAGLIAGALVSGAVWKIPKPIVDKMYEKRVEKFVLQMVDGLGLMSNGLKSGLSVVQALGLVSQEMPNPIQQEFNLILSENKLGVSIEDAFLNLSKRIKSDDVEMFVTSVNILKETGGNLAETFDTIVTTIRERIKVQSKISAMVAQGFYQGVFVMAIPPILGAVFYQTDPEFMKPLFTTAMGWGLILLIVVLESIGFFVIMKIIKIEV